MAIYYPSSTDQRDVSATPFLQEPPGSSPYNELCLPRSNMMMYMNQGAPSSSYMEFMSEHSLSQHECVDIPSVAGGGNGLLNIPTTVTVTSVGEQTGGGAGGPYNDVFNENSRKIPRMQLDMLGGDQNVQNQGLSLSLSTQIQSGISTSHYQFSSSGLNSFSISTHQLPMPGDVTTSSNYMQLPVEFPGDYGHTFKHEAQYSPQLSMGSKHSHYNPIMYDSFSHTKTICDSKFLKAAQQLLDEVVSVQDALKRPEDKTPTTLQAGLDNSKEAGEKSSGNATLGQNDASTIELSSKEKQDLQNKKTKLMSMLDEVDRRFSQYYHQMHVIVSSFDMVAGSGAAKPYTKLALQTISRRFRCLRDAIVSQVQATRRSLGEQDTSPNLLGGGIPRLRYVDQQLRQQRALHQLGVSRHSWRPQRGLPESSVTILRAWLFEHFLHPYPKESEKVMLARQTGLTRGQVTNWFINARVRLWKPMVEEMYKEEFGESETTSLSSPDRLSNIPKGGSSWGPMDPADEDLQKNLMSLANAGDHPPKFSYPIHGHNFTGSLESNGPLADFFQSRSHSEDDLGFGMMKFEGDRRHNVLDHGLYQTELVPLNQNGDRSSLARDSQVSLGLGVSGSRP